MYDQDLVIRQLDELDARIAALRDFTPITPDRLDADPIVAGAVERYLQIAIQAAIDIASCHTGGSVRATCVYACDDEAHSPLRSGLFRFLPLRRSDTFQGACVVIAVAGCMMLVGSAAG